MSPHRFVVRRQVYTPPDVAGVRRLLPEKYERVATFAKAEQAFADCAKRLAEFRRTTNPFQLGGPCLFYQTNLPAFAFHDYLLDHNITPPPTSLTANPNYVFWWVKNNRTFTDREREVVWRACDKLKPFEVIEEDDRKAVFVVMDVVFYEWFDEWIGVRGNIWLRTREGGIPFTAHGTIRDARRVAREQHGAICSQRLEQEFDLGAGLVSAEEVPEFATVVAVPARNPAPPNQLVYLAVRQAFWPSGGYELAAFPATHNADARVVLSSFGQESLAEAERVRLTAVARRAANPFAVVWPDGFNYGSLLEEDNTDERLLPNGVTIDDALEIVRKLPTIPPAPEVLTADWYDRVVQWSPEFIDVIWSTFADFRLFEVIEVPLG